MTVAILDFPSRTPTSRDLMERALEPHVLMGMPHLTPSGLSETWLMKELGHRHWLMLARHLGMDNADFRTADGSAAYAAICATSLRRARFHLVAANDVIAIRSTLTPVSRTRMGSLHRIFVDDRLVGEVELLSAFVHRLTEGDNHSIARVPLPGRPQAAYMRNGLAERAARMRADCHRPAGLADVDAATSFVFRPSLSQEFNGAGLFYFAEFQAMMERAFEQLPSPEGPRTNVSKREVFFFGNIRRDESLTVRIDVSAAEAADYRLYRPDGQMIAFAVESRL